MHVSVVVLAALAIVTGMPWGVMGLEHTALVQHYEPSGNFLFRTGSPLNTTYTGVDFDGLMAQFKNASEQAGYLWPDKYYVEDYSFWKHEVDWLAAEKDWWEANPDKGNFTNWPVVCLADSRCERGCETVGISPCMSSCQPDTINSSDVVKMAKGYDEWADWDSLDFRLAAINTKLKTKFSVPHILFFHCTGGCDRTGEFAASYNMRYLGKNFTEAMAYDEGLIGRHISYSCQVNAQWYCEKGVVDGWYNYSDCGNCKPFRCSDNTTFI